MKSVAGMQLKDDGLYEIFSIQTTLSHYHCIIKKIKTLKNISLMILVISS